jgi:hypothetical protein
MANYLTLKEPGSIVGGWTPNSLKERTSMAREPGDSSQLTGGDTPSLGSRWGNFQGGIRWTGLILQPDQAMMPVTSDRCVR